MSSFESENNLNAKQVTAIEALLSTPSVSAAARKCKIARATLDRWLRDEDFKRELSRNQNLLLDGTIRRLVALCGTATEVLEGVLQDKEASNGERLRAAQLVLEHTLRINESIEIKREIEWLKDKINEVGKSPRTTSKTVL